MPRIESYRNENTTKGKYYEAQQNGGSFLRGTSFSSEPAQSNVSCTRLCESVSGQVKSTAVSQSITD